MLYLVGAGFKPSDLTLEAVDVLKSCSRVYFEAYTSVYDTEALSKLFDFKELSRKEVEEGDLLDQAADNDVGLVVAGDPLIATTHASLVSEARSKGIEVKVVHAPSIYSAVAETGLHIYKFGKTTTLPKPEPDYAPTSFIDTIEANIGIGAHTLVLLDIGMSIPDACDMLEPLGDIEIVAAHIGEETRIVFGPMKEVSKVQLEHPCCIVVPAELHFTEQELLDFYKV